MFIKNIYHDLKVFIRAHRHRIGQNLFAESLMKRKGMEKHSHSVEILALGSSHCARSFYADLIKNAYNLGNSNQDLYTSYQLLKKYIPIMENLKHVILFFAVFSVGHELSKTNVAKQVAINHYVFDIPYPVSYLGSWKKAAKHRYKKFDDSNINYETFFGFTFDEEANPTEVEKRCSKHIRENQRKIHQIKYVKMMADLCKKKNIKFTIIACPCRRDYEQFILERVSDPFIELKKILKVPKYQWIQFFDWNTWKNFTDVDFSDTDHTNLNGAKKLTLQLAKKLHLLLKK